jgi:hypothetical protein
MVMGRAQAKTFATDLPALASVPEAALQGVVYQVVCLIVRYSDGVLSDG